VIEPIPAPRSAEQWLRDAGLEPRFWSSGPHARFEPHRHERPKRLFVQRGSISFNGEWLQAPAGIRSPAGFEHSAVTGDTGVECVEAFE
jgi:hypothetical protein